MSWWSRSNRYFDEAFLKNDFCHACDVCDRIWFRKDNFMKFRFNLDCRSSASTTLGNPCLDLTFTRNVSVQTLVSSTCSEQINVK
jgi:hypothetical protein